MHMGETGKEGIDLMVERDSGVKGPSPWYYIMGGVWVRTKKGRMKAGGELVKRRKPCLEGDYVHLNCWEGCYRVLYADVSGFKVRRNGKEVLLSWDNFRCLKGHGQSPEKRIKVLRRILMERVLKNI
jgi:hypothetical protein